MLLFMFIPHIIIVRYDVFVIIYDLKEIIFSLKEIIHGHVKFIKLSYNLST